MESQLSLIQTINACEQTNLLFIYFTVSAIWLISQVDFSLLSRGKLSPTLCRCRCCCYYCWPATESCPGANAPIRYDTLRYETIRNVYDTDKRNIFAWGSSDSNVVWVCISMCAYVCLRAGSPFWPNGVRQTAVAVGEQRERKGSRSCSCNVDNQQTQCANNSPACIIDEQLLLLLLLILLCLDLLLLLLLNFFVKKNYCVYLNKKSEKKNQTNAK